MVISNEFFRNTIHHSVNRNTTTEQAASLIREGIKNNVQQIQKKIVGYQNSVSYNNFLSLIQLNCFLKAAYSLLKRMAHQTMKKVVALLNLSLLFGQSTYSRQNNFRIILNGKTLLYSGLSWIFWLHSDGLRISSKIMSRTFRSITQSNNPQSAEGKGEQSINAKLETNSV